MLGLNIPTSLDLNKCRKKDFVLVCLVIRRYQEDLERPVSKDVIRNSVQKLCLMEFSWLSIPIDNSLLHPPNNANERQLESIHYQAHYRKIVLSI